MKENNLVPAGKTAQLGSPDISSFSSRRFLVWSPLLIYLCSLNTVNLVWSDDSKHPRPFSVDSSCFEVPEGRVGFAVPPLDIGPFDPR